MQPEIHTWLEGNGEVFLSDIGIRKGQVVLDFGCRVGHYTTPAARVAGEQGRLFAVDKQSDALRQLMKMAKTEGLHNIVPIRTSGELNIPLGEGLIDGVLFYDVLHYIDERRNIFKETYRILRAGGVLSVYPKHHKFDNPLWALADMKLEDIMKEIEQMNFPL